MALEEMFDKDEISSISFAISKNIEYLERYGKTDSLSISDRVTSFRIQSHKIMNEFRPKLIAEFNGEFSTYNIFCDDIWRSFSSKIKNNLQNDYDYQIYGSYLNIYPQLVSVLPISDNIENALKCKSPEIENIKAEYSISIFNPIGNKKLNIDEDYKKISSLLNKIYLYYKEALSNKKIDKEFYDMLVVRVNSLANTKNRVDNWFKSEKDLEYFRKKLEGAERFLENDREMLKDTEEDIVLFSCPNNKEKIN